MPDIRSVRTASDLASCLQIPHLYSDGAPGHPGDHQRARPPQVPQVVQVHHRGPENGPVDHHRRGPQEAGLHQGGVYGKILSMQWFI